MGIIFYIMIGIFPLLLFLARDELSNKWLLILGGPWAALGLGALLIGIQFFWYLVGYSAFMNAVLMLINFGGSLMKK